MKKVYIYVIAIFIILNISILYFSKTLAYDNRPIYEVASNDTDDYFTMFNLIKKEINNSSSNYIFIGDSVAYGIPCESTNTISFDFSTKISDNVYNLSMPSLYSGDIYFLLSQIHPNSNHLIYFVNYMNFIDKETNDPLEAVFWFKDEIVNNGFDSWYTPLEKSEYTDFKESMLDLIPLYHYRNYLRFYLKDTFSIDQTQLLSWKEKPFLLDLIHENEYAKFFSDKTLIMDDSNPQVYFINKILNDYNFESVTVVYMPLNESLISDYSNNEGFKINELKINNYFEALDIQYINFKNRIDTNYYSDHIHLLPDGYNFVSDILYKELIGD